MATIFALAFGYFSIAYYAYKAIKLLKENWGVISAPLSFLFSRIIRVLLWKEVDRYGRHLSCLNHI